ncbi:MAG TPA: hypothetical protein VN703_07395, partial [Candidatus Sulfopaludibacter sp.]|nr:hypothetical protein [Candidatus Sulfopaludibacter sp.]
SNDNPISFDAFNFGQLTANYIIPFTFDIPKEFYLTFFAIIPPSLIIPSVVRWFISKNNAKKQRLYLEKYIKIIDDELGHSHKNTSIQNVDRLRNQIEILYVDGKINESTYTILKNRLSEYSQKEVEKK